MILGDHLPNPLTGDNDAQRTPPPDRRTRRARRSTRLRPRLARRAPPARLHPLSAARRARGDRRAHHAAAARHGSARSIRFARPRITPRSMCSRTGGQRWSRDAAHCGAPTRISVWIRGFRASCSRRTWLACWPRGAASPRTSKRSTARHFAVSPCSHARSSAHPPLWIRARSGARTHRSGSTPQQRPQPPSGSAAAAASSPWI